VAISGGWLAVGAPSDSIAGYEAGAFSTYFLLDGQWILQTTVRPETGVQNTRLGFGLALEGSRMLVSTRPDSSGTGSTELWTESGGVWNRQGTIYSGNVPAIRPDRAIVGAPYADEGAVDSGASRLVVWNSDCNANGVPDRCDIDAGTESDVNSDGVPDSCGGLVYDLDGSGNVDFGDVGILLLDAGTCPAPCPADLSGDGVVDSADIALLLLQFG
jgi:hypothetical protein